MNARAKAVVVPLVVLAVWLFPSAPPETVVAGVVEIAPIEPASSVFEPLADAAPTTGVDTVPASTVERSPGTLVDPPPASSTTHLPAPATTAQLEPQPSTTVATTTTVVASRGDQALARVSYDWRTRFPDWTVEFEPAREGIRALTYPAERRIEVFVRPSDTAATLHRVFAHELGHLIDVELNDDADRSRWLDTRGIDQETPWWPSASAPDFDTGAGDFAEAFAVWETGVSSRSTVGGQPDSDDLALLRELASP